MRRQLVCHYARSQLVGVVTWLGKASEHLAFGGLGRADNNAGGYKVLDDVGSFLTIDYRTVTKILKYYVVTTTFKTHLSRRVINVSVIAIRSLWCRNLFSPR